MKLFWFLIQLTEECNKREETPRERFHPVPNNSIRHVSMSPPIQLREIWWII